MTKEWEESNNSISRRKARKKKEAAENPDAAAAPPLPVVGRRFGGGFEIESIVQMQRAERERMTARKKREELNAQESLALLDSTSGSFFGLPGGGVGGSLRRFSDIEVQQPQRDNTGTSPTRNRPALVIDIDGSDLFVPKRKGRLRGASSSSTSGASPPKAAVPTSDSTKLSASTLLATTSVGGSAVNETLPVAGAKQQPVFRWNDGKRAPFTVSSLERTMLPRHELNRAVPSAFAGVTDDKPPPGFNQPSPTKRSAHAQRQVPSTFKAFEVDSPLLAKFKDGNGDSGGSPRKKSVATKKGAHVGTAVGGGLGRNRQQFTAALLSTHVVTLEEQNRGGTKKTELEAANSKLNAQVQAMIENEPPDPVTGIPEEPEERSHRQKLLCKLMGFPAKWAQPQEPTVKEKLLHSINDMVEEYGVRQALYNYSAMQHLAEGGLLDGLLVDKMNKALKENLSFERFASRLECTQAGGMKGGMEFSEAGAPLEVVAAQLTDVFIGPSDFTLPLPVQRLVEADLQVLPPSVREGRIAAIPPHPSECGPHNVAAVSSSGRSDATWSKHGSNARGTKLPELTQWQYLMLAFRLVIRSVIRFATFPSGCNSDRVRAKLLLLLTGSDGNPNDREQQEMFADCALNEGNYHPLRLFNSIFWFCGVAAFFAHDCVPMQEKRLEQMRLWASAMSWAGRGNNVAMDLIPAIVAHSVCLSLETFFPATFMFLKFEDVIKLQEDLTVPGMATPNEDATSVAGGNVSLSGGAVASPTSTASRSKSRSIIRRRSLVSLADEEEQCKAQKGAAFRLQLYRLAVGDLNDRVATLVHMFFTGNKPGRMLLAELRRRHFSSNHISLLGSEPFLKAITVPNGNNINCVTTSPSAAAKKKTAAATASERSSVRQSNASSRRSSATSLMSEFAWARKESAQTDKNVTSPRSDGDLAVVSPTSKPENNGSASTELVYDVGNPYIRQALDRVKRLLNNMEPGGALDVPENNLIPIFNV